jgi:hypothetical protein|tara:strand:+ start:2596 stop:2808 length:213 start_codon:yes stop_codon:yes gene_type:complete
LCKHSKATLSESLVAKSLAIYTIRCFKAPEPMSAAITLCPEAERATTVALSIPFAAPVTKTTLFLKFNSL